MSGQNYSYSWISAGVAALPTGYINLKYAYVSTTPLTKLERRSAEWIYQNTDRTGSCIPKFSGRDASNFIFGPYPAVYTVTGVYYKNVGPLSTTLHNLFVNNPDLYLFACLAESEVVIGRDARIQLWEAKYQKILNDVNLLAKSEDSSGGLLQVRAG